MEVNSTNTIDGSFYFPHSLVPGEVSYSQMNILLDQKLQIKIISKPKIFHRSKVLSIISLSIFFTGMNLFLWNRGYFGNKHPKIYTSNPNKIKQINDLEMIRHSTKVKSPPDTSLHVNISIRNKTENFKNSVEGESILNKKGFPVIIDLRNRNIFKDKSKQGTQSAKIVRKVLNDQH